MITLIGSTIALGDEAPRFMLTAGTVASTTSRFTYIGGDAALFGNLHTCGLRLRFLAGTGADTNQSGTRHADFRVLRFMAGYQFIGARAGASIMAGWQQETRDPSPPDPFDVKAGRHDGVSIEADAYWRPNDRWLISVWTQWSQANHSRAARIAGIRSITPRFSLGAEAAYYRDIGGRDVKLGGIARWRIGTHRSLQAVAGVVRDKYRSSPYGALHLMVKR